MNKQVRPPNIDATQEKKSVDDLLRGFSSGISYRALEPRIAFDGAAVATAAATADAQHQTADADAKPVDSHNTPHSESASHDGDAAKAGDASPADAHAAGNSEDASAALADAIITADAPQHAAPVTIVFIDKSVDSIDQIISSTDPSWEIVMIDDSSSGLSQMASYLTGRTDVGSIHVVSHGEAGTLYIGSDTLTNANIADFQAQLTAIGHALSDSGDILLYGCDIAAGNGGMDLVRSFSDMTGADVAASVNRTGGDESGGDWVLEATSGSIEATALSNPLYAGLLTKTNTGAWAANGATAANDWTNTTDGITTTVTFTNGGNGTWTGTANDTLNTAAGGLNATTFDNGAVGGASILSTFTTDNTNDVGTITITFSTAVTNPVIHIDRLGGISGTANSAVLTLTSGGSLTRLSGVGHFLVDTNAGSITRQVGVNTTGSESNTNSASGTAAGSVRVNGTYTTITFSVRMNTAASAGIGDAFELALAIDAPPTAVNDTFSTTKGVASTINVRANDTDPRGDTLTVTQVNGTSITAGGAGISVTGGVVTLNTSGNLVFTPNANYTGSPSFTYTIADPNGGTSTATVSGTVTNIAPVIDLNSTGSVGDTNRGYSATFNTGSPTAIAVAAATADVFESGENDITRMTIVAGGTTLGATDRVNIAGQSITLNADATINNVTVGGSTVNISYVGSTRTFAITNAAGATTAINQTDLDTLTRGITYQSTSLTQPASSRTLSFTVTDTDGATSTAAVSTISFLAPPVAGNDTFTTLHDTAATINVRANDSDPQGDALTVTAVNGTAITAGGAGVNVTGGVVTLNTSGNLVFTPMANYVGSTSFTYTVSDPTGGSAVATVSGTVTNTAPVLDLDASGAGTGYSTTFTENGAAVSIADTDAVMTDVDDANLESATVTLTNQQSGDRLLVNGASASSGTIGSIAWTRTDTTVTFTGSATKAQYAAAIQLIQFENTTDTPATTARIINTVVNDGNANSNIAVTTVAINRAPDPTDDAFSGSEDTAIAANVLTNDTDVGDGPASPPLSIVTGPSNGVLTSFNTTTGAFVYTPNANYNGTDIFTYRYTDINGDSKVATVTLTIAPVNDAPVNTVPTTIGPVAEDGTLNITGVSVADIDSGSLTTTLTIGNGALAITATGGATVSGSGTGTITLVGSAAQINTALATLSFTPTADYNGTTTFQISTNDGALTDTDSRTITVTPVADIVNDVVVTNEDTIVSFNVISGLNETSGADNFEGTPVVTAINGAAYTAGTPISITGGQITVQPNGVVTFNPTANYNGATSFTYTVTSGGVTETATVNITVNPVNDAPVATNDAGTATEAGGVSNGTAGSNATGNVLTNDTDIDTPAANLSVTAIRLGGTEGSGSAGTVGTALVGTYGTLTLNANGTYTYVVNNANATVQALAVGQTLTENFNYTVSDGSLTDIAVLTITINGANDAPVATNDTGTIAEDTTLTVNAASGLLANDTDVDGGALSITQFTVSGVSGTFTAGSSATIPSVGTLTINANGSYTFVPAANYNGSVPVATYTVSDGAGGTATATLSIAITPVNDAPVATNDTGTIAEDTTLTVPAATGLLANDTDVDGNTLSVTQFTVAGVSGTFTAGSSATIPSVGTLTINANGSYTFVPAANYNGSVPVATYTISDGAGGTATATLSIAVTPVNDAPVATNDAGTATEAGGVSNGTAGSNATGNVLTNDTDIDTPAANLSVTAIRLGGTEGSGTAGTVGTALVGTYGTLTLNANGTYTYVVNNANPTVQALAVGQTLTENFNYTVSDGSLTDIAVLTITINGANDAPVAANDTGTVAEDTTLTVPAATGLLANDTDVDGGALSITQFTVSGVSGTFTAGSSATIPSVGTLTINANGSYTFVPAANYNGSVPVATYTVSDGAGGTATATLSIAVTPVNDAPVNTVPGPRTAAEDTATAIAGVSVSDVDGGSLTTTVSVTNGTLNVTLGGGATITGNGSGTITLTGTAATINAALAGLSFTGNADYNGPATLTVQTSDGSLTDTDTVAITVTPIADITNDTISGTEDTASTFNVLTGAGGATADNFEGTPSVTSVTQPTNGSVTFAANGSITYTPAANFNGTDTFTYTVTSGGVTETATVTINVAAVNDAPVNSVPGAQTTAEDSNIIFSSANGNAITVVDVDSSVTTTLTVANGALTLGSISGVTVTGNGTGTVTVSGTPAAVTAALSGLRFAPTADWNGNTTLSVSTSDGAAPAVANTIAITVTPVADIVANSATTAEDTASTFNVLTNDNFENPGATVSSVTQPTNGTVTIGTGGNVTYTPNANYNGTDSFTYTVTSGGVTETTTVTMTVTPVNDAPVAANDVGTATEAGGVSNGTAGSNATGNVLANDTDIDTPAANLSVTAIRLGGTEGSGAAGTVGTALVGTYGTLTLNANGTYTYVVNNANPTVQALAVGQTLTENFNYTVSDGSLTDIAVLTITINGANDAPVATNDTGTIAEDTTLTVNAAAGLLANDTDVDGGTLSITQFTVSGVSGTFTAGSSATIPSVGTLTINANGSYTFVPAANYNGSVPVATYTVSDGAGGTATAMLSIAVTPVNDAPVATNDTGTVAEDTTLTVNAASGLLANDTDVDGNTLSVTQFTVAGVSGTFTAGSSATIPSVGTLTINANGSYTFVPAANYNGSVPVATYTISDGAGGTATATLSIAVTPVNDAPVATNDTGTATEAGGVSNGTAGSNATGNVLTNDTDIDTPAANLSVTAIRLGGTEGSGTAGTVGTALVGTYGTLTLNANGTYTYVVNNANPTVQALAVGQTLTENFNYTVSDGSLTDIAVLTITINGANDAPVAANDTGTVAEDTTLTVNAAAGLLANDTDVDGGALSITQFTVSGVSGTFTAGSSATIPSVGTLTINANGSYTFVPAANYNGSVPVATYTVSDGAGGTATATLSIAVTPVNDAPVNTVPGPRTAAEDTATAIAGVSVADVDGGSLTTTVSVTNGTLNVTLGGGATITGNGSGTITLTGTAATINAALAGLSFTGNADYNGPATLTVQTSDGSLTDTDTVAITVTPIADIVADNVNGTEDATLSFNVLTGAGGASADNFEGSPTVTAFTQPTNGSVTVAANGAVVYTPNANFNGTDTFTYTVTSGGVTETTTVTINVAAVNDAPTQLLPPAQNGTEDTNVVFSGANGNQIVLGDVDAGAVVTTTISVPGGSLTAITTPGVTITGNGTGSVVLSGVPAAVTAALNGLTYAPVADANGSVVMSVSTSDGIAPAVSGTVAINVAPVADIQNDTVTTNEDNSATVSVLVNDSFENPGRTVTSVTNGANGTVVINGNGTVTYTPNANFNGTDSFTYTVTSGGVTETATVFVTVNPVNDAATQTTPPNQSTAEDTALVFNAANGNAITVADVDGDTLTTTVSVTNGRVNLGSVAGVTVSGNGTGTVTLSGSAAAINAALNGLSFTPTADFNGASAMTVTTSDGATTASNTVAITVSPVVDIVADAITTNEDTAVVFNVLTNDNFENAGRTVTSVTQPPNGTVTIGSGGQLTYTPNANFNGTNTFTYTVTSGGVTETATVTVTVNPVNDPVVTTVPGAQSTNEDTSVIFSTTNGNAITVADIDGDTISMTVSATNGRLTLGGTSGVTVSGNGTGTVTLSGSTAAINTALNGLRFAPTADYNGSAAITVQASDGSTSTNNTIAVSIAPVADVVADSISTDEDTPITFNALTNDTFENPGRTVTSVTQGSSGSVTFAANGTMTYTPNLDFTGTDTFTYTVTSNGTTETTTVTVTIGGVNDVPVTTGLPDRAGQDAGVVSLDVSGAFGDEDGDTLTYSATGLPAGLTINPTTGVITGTIDKGASQTSPYSVTITANDGSPGGTVSTAFTWTISNPPPTANNDAITIAEDSAPTNIDVLANDVDPDGDTLSVTTATAGNGTVTILPNGTVRYQPNANFNGTDTISYQISDGNGGVSTATVTVTVTPVNDAPVADDETGTTPEDTTLTVPAASGLLVGDTDVDGDTLSITQFAVAGVTGTFTAGTTATIPSVGTLRINADGSYTFTPAANYNGSVPVATYTVSDGHGGTDTGTLTLTVTPVNDAPVAVDDVGTATEDTTLTINAASGLLANDTDVDGDTLSITQFTIAGVTGTFTAGSSATISGVGTLTINANGSYTFVPAANYNGTVPVATYTISDGNGGTDTGTLTLAVTPVNDAPVATNDSYSMAEDNGSITLTPLANDTDADGDTLLIQSINGVALTPGVAQTIAVPNGTVTITTAGVISFTPAANYNGTTSFSYVARDPSGATSAATISVVVTPVNDAPVAVDDVGTATEDTTLTVNPASGLLSNDADVDGNALSVTQFTVAGVTGTFTAGSSATISGVGTLTINANGSYTFVPSANYNGAVPVATYTVSDGNGGTDTGTLTIAVTPVNDAPVADDETGTTPEDMTLTVPAASGLLVGDTDVDGDALSITQFTVAGVSGTFTAGTTATIPSVGTLRINADGSYTFTPAANYNGSVPVATYTVSDGNGGTDTGTLTLAVTPVNDAPVVNPIVDRSNADGQTVSVNVAANFSDPDVGDTLTYSATGLPTGLTINPATGVISGTIDRAASQGGTGGAYSVTITATDANGATVSDTFVWSISNPTPTAVSDTNTTSEGATLNVAAASGVLSNDSDPDGDPLTVSAINGVPANVGQPVAGSAGGIFTINANGSYSFQPNGQFEDLGVGETRQTTVTYTVSDGNGGTSVASVTITVTGTNDAPVSTAIPPASSVDSATFSLNAATSFSDVDGDTLTYTATGLPAGLTINSATGVISGTIDRAASQGGVGGVYTITITANDGHGGTTPATLTLTVTNPAPNAADDSRGVTEDTVATGNVLANDVDPDGDTLSVTGFTVNGIAGTFNPGDTASIPGVGTLTIEANGTYTFTPAPDYVGAVPQVTYAITDGNGGTDTATLDLGPVTSGNDAPQSTALPGQSGADSSNVSINVSGNFSDGDGDTLTFSATGLPPGLSINPSTGVISGTIDHLASANGPYSVTVRATDPSGASTQQTFSWAVSNPAPTGTAIGNSTGVDGTSVSLPVGAGFSDPDGDTLTFTASGLPSGLSINPATGVISGTLSRDASVGGPTSNGVYTIAVTATDSQGALVTQTFTYTASNPAPIAGDDAFTGDEDTPLTRSVAGNDSDPDGDALSYSVVTGPANGTILFNPDGTFTYTPAANYNGSDTFTYRVTDANGATATATVTLTVTPVNDAPVASNVSVTTPEDSTFNGTLTATDVDSPTLTFTKASDPSHGTVVVNPDGTYVYTPTADYNGPDSFTYTVSDGSGGTVTRTVTINVTPVNDAPAADNETGTTPEDTPLSVPASSGLLVGDTDIDGDALSITQFTIAGSGTVYTAGSTATIPSVGTLRINADGSYVFAPAANYNGPVPVATYTVSDGNGGTDTATLTLTVTPVNDAPVASNVTVTTPEDSTFNGTLTATDVDSPTLTFTKASDPSHGTVVVNPNGTYVYTPIADYNGPDSFTYTVSDGSGGTVTRTVTINVTPVNDAPIAIDDAFSGNEDTVITGDVTPATSGQDRDIDGDVITVVDADGNASNGLSPVSGPANGTLILNADGTFSYTPNANFHGTDSFRYRISDGNGGIAEATVYLTVNPVNDAPIAANGNATTPEDTPYSGTLPPASDVDGDSVTYVKASNPSHGTVVVNGDGTYVYTPSANYSGTDTFTYSVNDGKGGVSTYTVTVIVTPVNDAPEIISVTAPPSKDSDTIRFDLSTFVKDAEGDQLVYTATGLPPGLTVDAATGLVSGTLTKDASQGGPYTVTLTVNDGHGGVVTTTFTWPVENPPPIAIDDRATVQRDKEVTVNVLANDRDPDGDALTVTTANAANGSVEVLPDGSIRYVPKADFVGQDRIRYVISDGNGGHAIAYVTITVTGDDGYHDKPIQFGFNGPGDPDAIDALPSLPQISQGIAADGAVVDAVFEIGLLRSIANQLGVDGAVLAAANGLRSLDGIASLGDHGIILETVRAERARDILFNAGFERSFQEYPIEGLPGFSLRHDVPGNLGGLSAREQVIIESLVRDNTLIVQLSNTIEHGQKRIVDYRITQADGSPLPGWFNQAAKDLLIGRREATTERLDLKIEAVYSDKSVITEFVRIDTATGEIQPLKLKDGSVTAPRLFGDQFHAPSQLTPDEIQGLGKAIGR